MTKFLAYCIVTLGIVAGVTVGIARGPQEGILTGILAWILFGGIEFAYIAYINRVGK